MSGPDLISYAELFGGEQLFEKRALVLKGYLLDCAKEVGVFAIKLVDEDDPRHIGRFRRLPGRLGTHLDAAGKLLEQNAERHLKSAARMHELFRDLPEAIANTVRLAERLDFTLENLGYEFPSYPIPPGHTMDSFLREQAFAGARNRYSEKIPEKVRGQLETELALIAKLKVGGQNTGYPSEFLEARTPDRCRRFGVWAAYHRL